MMFMVLLMTAMGCSLTACSDDDDNGGGGGNGGITFSKDSETAMSLLSILSPLADVTELPDNWNSNAYTVEYVANPDAGTATVNIKGKSATISYAVLGTADMTISTATLLTKYKKDAPIQHSADSDFKDYGKLLHD